MESRSISSRLDLEREKDLSDLVWLLQENYLDASNDDDFERLLSTGTDVAVAHALLLGRDIAMYPGAREVARRFVERLKTAYAFAYRKVRGESIEDDPLFATFELGLSTRQPD